MQIIASTQNEKLLNLATSAGERNTGSSSGLDFSYLFNLAKTDNYTKASPIKQQSKATRIDRNTKSLYENNKNSLDGGRKDNLTTFKKEDNISFNKKNNERKIGVSASSSVDKNNKVETVKDFDESENAVIKEHVTKAQNENINVYEVNTDVITDKENNQAVSELALTGSKTLEKAAVQSESRPITEEDIELLESLKNAENMNPDEISDPKTESLTDIFLKSTLKIKEEDEVDGEPADEETEEETANNIADNAKKLAIKDPSSTDKTLKTQIASMLAELNAESVEVVDKIDAAQSINDDEFGAKTFEAIEDSIIASMELEENSQNIEKEELLPEETEVSEFKKSMDILKAAVKGSESETDVSEESFAPDEFVGADENPSNSRENNRNAVVFGDQKNTDSLKGGNSSSSKDGGSSLGNQNHTSASEFIKAMNAKSAANQSTQSSFSTLLMSSNLKQNAQQITESVMKMASRNLKTVNIQLSPEGMGKLKISIDMTKSEEVASVSISASNQATKQLVEQGLTDLKERLMANDIKADPKVEEYNEQDQSGQKNNQSGKNSKDHENEQKFSGNGENIGLFDENMSFESLIDSQNIDFMNKFA